MTLQTIVIELTPEECDAIKDFYSYGATRGNHIDGTGSSPGPLTGRIIPMGEVCLKIYKAQCALNEKR